jgi:hypothetical protein
MSDKHMNIVTDHFMKVYPDFGYQEDSPSESTTSGTYGEVSSHSDKKEEGITLIALPLQFTATLFQSGIYHVADPYLRSDHSRNQVETFSSEQAKDSSAYMLENTHFKNSLLVTSKNTTRS